MTKPVNLSKMEFKIIPPYKILHIPIYALSWASCFQDLDLGEGIVKVPHRITGGIAFRPTESIAHELESIICHVVDFIILPPNVLPDGNISLSLHFFPVSLLH